MTFTLFYDKILIGDIMKNRSEIREDAMKVLYQVYILSTSNLEYDIPSLIKEQNEVENDFLNDLVNGCIKYEKEITALADKYLENWSLDRLNKVDKAIFCIGIYELVYTKTPCVVAINEALELSKKYSDEKVTKMLNGVLDNIFHNEEIQGE